MSKDALVTYLELIAAKAKQLAEDVKHNRTWPEDVPMGLGEIMETARKAGIAARSH